jgi:hypothetical protein
MNKNPAPRGVAPQVSISGKYTEKEYRQHLREENRKSDNKNLPFTFKTVKSGKPRNKGYVCSCEAVIWVNKDCYMVICDRCGELKKTAELSGIGEEVLVNTQINIPQYKDVINKPGPFTKNPAKDSSKGKWV